MWFSRFHLMCIDGNYSTVIINFWKTASDTNYFYGLGGFNFDFDTNLLFTLLKNIRSS